MIVGGYEVNLYCDHPEHLHPMQTGADYFGQSLSACIRQAKKDGWLFRLKKSPQEAICPECRKKKVDTSHGGA